MNLLAHLYLAERSATSAAGQILGDIVKGRLDALRFDARTDQGIRLHRRIDAISDADPAHRAVRGLFVPPLRRYAGIIADIGFDHALARNWSAYRNESLADFAARMAARVAREWPAEAPVPAPRPERFAALLVGYTEANGIGRALSAVAQRAKRRTPLNNALPALLAHYDQFAAHLPGLMSRLHTDVERYASQT